MDAESGVFGEQPRLPLDSTQMFAGPNDGLSQTCNGVSTFVGLQGHSHKTGYRVIFPTLDMGRYLEIAEADILESEELSPAHSPFGALGGTRLSVRESARILTSRAVSSAQEVDDEFDLDIRLGASGWSMPGGAPEEAIYAAEGGEKPKAIKTNGACPTETCKTCVTCGQTCRTCAGENTCQTCATHCQQHTCAQTCQTCAGENTCQTCAGQNTCQTCAGQNTCQTCKGENTCQTCAGQNTCQTCKGEVTCQTCATHCQQNTCGVTCHTCPDICVPKTETCCKKGTCI